MKSILNLALDENSELTDKIKHKQSCGRNRENPFKEQLEREGIVFPSEPALYDEICDEDESDLPQYMPTTKEEEEEQLKIALSISAKSDSTYPPTQIQRQRQEIPETMNQYANHQYPEPQVIQPQSPWFYLPSYMPNNFPYQTPAIFYLPNMESHGSRSSTVGASSTCTITSLQPAQDCNNTEGQMNALPSVERAGDITVASKCFFNFTLPQLQPKAMMLIERTYAQNHLFSADIYTSLLNDSIYIESATAYCEWHVYIILIYICFLWLCSIKFSVITCTTVRISLHGRDYTSIHIYRCMLIYIYESDFVFNSISVPSIHQGTRLKLSYSYKFFCISQSKLSNQ